MILFADIFFCNNLGLKHMHFACTNICDLYVKGRQILIFGNTHKEAVLNCESSQQTESLPTKESDSLQGLIFVSTSSSCSRGVLCTQKL